MERGYYLCPESCPRAGEIKRSSANYKQLEETYQQASKEIELLSQSLSDLEANRLSLESLHEAEKLLQSVGYSVDSNWLRI